LNLVGDFGGGGMLLAFGMVAALLEAKTSGKGQVVDAAMVDGAASLMTMIHSFHQFGIWNESGGQHARYGRSLLRGLRDVRWKFFAVGGIESEVLRRAARGHGADG
jgi:alpha-methylacyl-CoA racemase